ncbi:MAG TPA: DUF2752 domain-containing protein [Chitinophagaceae bacterium]|jgi:hypothetical protein|nr:DUF2752 domain-containing protein [Chitinophagaceae bacterium]
MLKKIPLELLFWTSALVLLGITDPTTPHYSICVFRLLGWHHCPGCGLGHAIAFLLRGDIADSWRSHPLGGFALVVILHRIVVLSIDFYKTLKNSSYGSQQFLDAPRY